jgi:hypothetical protein
VGWAGDTDDVPEGTGNLYNRVPAAGAAGEVLAKVSATDYDSGWVTLPDTGFTPTNVHLDRLVSSRFYWPGTLNNAVAAGAANFIRAIPFYVPVATTFDRIACNVTTQGTAAAEVRLGIYNVANGVPTTLVLDAGSVGANTTGVKEITISVTLPRGWYALSANKNELAIALRRIVTSINLGQTNLAVQQPHDVWQVSSTFGALPSSFGTAAYQTGFGYLVALRAA